MTHLNRCHLAAEPIIAIANLRGQFITQLQDEIRSWNPPPPYAALFGSAARSAMRVDSDIDLVLTDIATEGIALSVPRRYLTSRKRQAHGTD